MYCKLDRFSAALLIAHVHCLDCSHIQGLTRHYLERSSNGPTSVMLEFCVLDSGSIRMGNLCQSRRGGSKIYVIYVRVGSGQLTALLRLFGSQESRAMGGTSCQN